MRRGPTPAEDMLWQRLRDRQLDGFKFRRQHSIDRFIVDFYCPEARLAVELDGPVHEQSVERDAIRQELLERRGLRVLRFTNDQAIESADAVLARIRHELERPHPHVEHRGP